MGPIRRGREHVAWLFYEALERLMMAGPVGAPIPTAGGEGQEEIDRNICGKNLVMDFCRAVRKSIWPGRGRGF
jgi:hypothetical protein